MTSGLDFLAAAKQCEIRELEQLALTSELVQHTAELVHALQKERGLSNLYLGSGGAQFGAARSRQAAQCLRVEGALHQAFDRLDTGGARIGNGARLFSRIAYVLHGLQALPALRERIEARGLAPAEATQAFVKLIAGLLAVVFEAADSATDPEISRLLVALFHFMQGKEFSGQERAAGAAAFTSGQAEAARQQQWLHLIDSQERCFKVFTEFAERGPVALWRHCQAGAALAELERLRRVACTAPVGSALDRALGQTWFDCCTERIDAMQAVEARLAADLLALCERKIAQARVDLQACQALRDTAPAAGLPPGAFFDAPAADGQVPALGPHLERSVLELVQEQSRRLQAMGDELATARAALNERKLVERAKGVLMAHRQLSEEDAYKLLRQTAMSQSRRLVDVAEAVLSMADFLPTRAR
ncbi:nitrate regulatory protein [Xylophilus sp. ASV27]|uniref:nitrate regulatory protein n=1 Tax=Xylophilus sp. ASV27 TaxID=2795129 RepID=UPI0018EDBC3F|nr:nitrate regulatory protein [Xylophilus sp. ASV27]